MLRYFEYRIFQIFKIIRIHHSAKQLKNILKCKECHLYLNTKVHYLNSEVVYITVFYFLWIHKIYSR